MTHEHSAPELASDIIPTSNRYHRWYPSLVGLLLGLLQTGLFFQLTFTLSSSFGTFLLVTLAWLVGSAVGVLYLAQFPIATRAFLGLALLAYCACAGLLALFPFSTAVWPLYAALILLTGLYPGIFFARLSAFYAARTLFFRENNGFIAGLVMGTMSFMLAGRLMLWILPLAVAALIYWLNEPRPTFEDIGV